MTKKILETGFKLFQPWVNDVVKGKLHLLVRSIPTKRRERVAVIATKGIDGVWLRGASVDEIKRIENRIGVIGSVKIKDCIKVASNKVEDKLIELGGRKYFEYYPKYLIPKKSRNDMVYIWVLEDAREWKKPKQIEGGGIIWAKLKLEDE